VGNLIIALPEIYWCKNYENNTESPKNVTTLPFHNSDIHESILIIFGTNKESRHSKGTSFSNLT